MKLLALLIALGLSCDDRQLQQEGAVLKGKGIVRLVDSVRGTYIIMTEDRKLYMPTNLQRAYRIDSLSVEFTATVDSTARLKHVRLPAFPIKIKKIAVRNE